MLNRTDPFEVKAAVLDLLGELTAEERLEVFAHFCTGCAMPKVGCGCSKEWADTWRHQSPVTFNDTGREA